jgi:hypothetical protein
VILFLNECRAVTACKRNDDLAAGEDIAETLAVIIANLEWLASRNV